MPLKGSNVVGLIVNLGEGPLLLAFAGFLWYQSRRRKIVSTQRLAEVKSKTKPGDDQRREALIQFEMERMIESQYSVSLDGSRGQHWFQIGKCLLTCLTLGWIAHMATKFGPPGHIMTIIGAIGGAIGAGLFAFFTGIGVLIVLGKELYCLFSQRPYWVDPADRLFDLLAGRVSE